MNSAFVTGGTGVIGLALLDCLLERGVTTTVLVRKGSPRRACIKPHALLNVVEGDLAAAQILEEGIGHHDAWFHLGWNTGSREVVADPVSQAESIAETLTAVQLAARAGCRVFVGTGSQAEYGSVGGRLSDDTPANPESPYGVAKLAAGRLSRFLCDRLGIRHCWCRVLSVYGPHDRETTGIMYVIRTLLAGRSPSLTACEQVWDYLYSRDCAEALVLSAASGRHGAVYPIGSGAPQSLRAYFECVRDEIDADLALGLGEKPYAPNQVMHLAADLSPLSRDTGFQPAYTFRDGIRETIAWCRSHRPDRTPD